MDINSAIYEALNESKNGELRTKFYQMLRKFGYDYEDAMEILLDYISDEELAKVLDDVIEPDED